MTVYYVGPDVRITHEVFESCRPAYRRFAIGELEYPHTVHEPALIATAASMPARICSVGACGAAMAVALAGWPVFDRPGISVLGLFLLAAAGVLVLTTGRARRRVIELRAVYRGRLVCLYSTTDRRALGQIRRALLRVVEQAEDAG